MERIVVTNRKKNNVDEIANPFVPFNKVYISGQESLNLLKVLESKELSCNGQFTKSVHKWLESNLGAQAAFLTGAGTLALEMAALLLDLEPGDEVIMPSFTYATTASAFVRANLVPKFVDICPDSLSFDLEQLNSSITSRTKAIVPVHYGGGASEMDGILEIASSHNLKVVEDAAHGILAKYNDRYLGTIAPMGILSFHETKNIVGGEGGALLVNDESLIPKAKQIWLRGTNKFEMDSGLTEKYSWTELGSSFAASELVASVVMAQLQQAYEICSLRTKVWNTYHRLLAGLEAAGYIRRPFVIDKCEPNGHIYYILTDSKKTRDELLSYLNSKNIECVFHYVPLHDSPAGKKYGKAHGLLPHTISVSESLIRLPMWVELDFETQQRVVATIEKFFRSRK